MKPLLLVIGSDAFNFLTGWHQWRRLFDFAHIVVMSRPGCQVIADQLQPFFKQRYCSTVEVLTSFSHGYLFFQPVTQLDISATQIRQTLIEKRNPRFLLPDSVLHYIKRNRLYAT